MPVIESGAVLYAETRVEELTRLRDLLHRERHRILAVRLGATDLCALYGLRRSPDLSIYDVKVVGDLIADVVNVLGRADGTGFTVTGPVWEYYGGPERIFKPLLRQSPFVDHDEPELRGQLVSRAIDGLIREVTLDRANGLLGKTAIHPSHVAVVNALSVVSHEEHRDAADVLGSARGGGVLASVHRNKMNEVRPHTAWARRTMLRARVFGVAAADVSFVDLLAASLPR
jgi:citrate lyase beta subunit